MTESFKVIMYILSLLVFPIGLVVGYVYKEKPDAPSKEFGTMCFTLGFIGLILWIIFIVMWAI